MSNCQNFQVKRKNPCDKDIQDFFFFIEDKLENNQSKIGQFIDLIHEFNSQNDDEILLKLKKLFSHCPILILELNKLLPKSIRLPLLDQENADNFLQKIRSRDEGIFKEIMKAILALKNGEITQEKIVSKFEELLSRYPDLLEEAYLFSDYKKINSANYRKNINSSNRNSSSNSQSMRVVDSRKASSGNPSYNDRHFIKNRDMTPITYKNQTSPDLVVLSKLKELFPQNEYKVIIKLLHLYNEGVLGHYEFIELVQPYFSLKIDLFEYLKTLTYSKMMNRRQYAIFNRPNCELDLSKSLRVASYYELPKEYPYRVSSTRNAFEQSILNDRLITIPTGSEDDKNPMKKNHYEENLFKFEDQRYEVDMLLEIFNFTVDALKALEKKVVDNEINQLNEEMLANELGKSNLRFISRYYREYGQKIIEGLMQHPKETIDIILKRFNKRIDETLNQKAEVEKTIKVSFERFYYKSFDYRSFKFKNFDKKNNNAKAFLKEIVNRKKDKLSTSNLNVLKGGTDNSEFFTSLNLKYHKENVMKKTEGQSAPILLNNIDLDTMRKKLPEIKLIFENLDILKLTIALVYYQIFNMSNIDTDKISEYFNPLFLNLFGMDLTNLVDNLKNNSSFINDKNLNYSEIIENIKNKVELNENDYKKFYQMDTLLNTIQIAQPSNGNNEGQTDDNMKDEDSVSLSIGSQEVGKAFKDIIIFNSEKNHNVAPDKCLFYPPKEEGDVMFYSNEHCFVFLRYIFCIYERLNKLNEYSRSNEGNSTLEHKENETEKEKETEKDSNLKLSPIIYQNDKKTETYYLTSVSSPPTNPLVFKNYLIIYKALLHKKIENSTVYEELCRDILGNESYFLFNMDKLINSLIKTMTTIINDNLSKEILNLFKFEISRKEAPNENLYFANYLQLLDNNTTSNFRILVNPKLSIMCIHLMDLPIEPNKKDYYDQFKEFVTKTLQASYAKMYEDNQSLDDPFNIFLNRNKEAVQKVRDCLKPAYRSNNLVFRFDYANKKLQYLKSGCDVLLHNKTKLDKLEKMKIIFSKNISFVLWNNSKNKINE